MEMSLRAGSKTALMENACFLSLGAAAQSRPSGSGSIVFQQHSAPGLRDCFLQGHRNAPALEKLRIFHKAG